MKPEEYAKLHQKAFRVAFDFLAAHFPPGFDSDWWEQTVADMSEASIKAGENNLVVGLLAAVFSYLEDEYRARRE